MPATAVGVTFGVLAAVAVGAIVTKAVIDNWDDVTEGYDAFADSVEDRHDVYLPRFHDRRRPHAAHGRADGSPWDDGGSSTARARARARESVRRRREWFGPPGERFSDVTPDEETITTTTNVSAGEVGNGEGEEEEEAFRASIKEFMKDVRFPHDKISPQGSPEVVQSGVQESLMEDHEDADKWSETWTVTDASVHSNASDHDQDHDWQSASDHDHDYDDGYRHTGGASLY